MELNEFLVKAKVKTYASGGEGGEKKLEDGSKEFLYEEDGWKYRDRYFGSRAFIGEEIVWKDGRVVWGMNYYGHTVGDRVTSKEVYEFLKKAMRQVSDDRPFRGPSDFHDGNFYYQDSSEGDIGAFHGAERITYDNELVYKLWYEGGLIQMNFISSLFAYSRE